MAFILPNWQNKNNRLYTQVMGNINKLDESLRYTY